MNSRGDLSAGARRHYDALDRERAKAQDAERRARAAEARAERLAEMLDELNRRLNGIEKKVETKQAAARAPVAEVVTPSGMLLYGLKAISSFMGVRTRQAQHLVETNQIPHFHMGRVICAERATLTAHLKAKQTEAMKETADG